MTFRTPQSDNSLRAHAGLRVQTLVRLRWLAILGQLAALMVVRYQLGFALPFWPALFLVLLSVWLNIVLLLRYPAGARLGEDAATGVLAFDIVQLALLLYLTGGLANPFALLFLAPVTVSATVLSTRRTLVLGLLTLALASLLVVFHLPLPWHPDRPLQLPRLYILGMWVALASGIAFTGLYVHRIAREARQMETALAATELALARQQQLYALDGLAAAAAHELSTPLATIAVVSQELRRSCLQGCTPTDDSERAMVCEDLELIAEQAARCREILARLADHRSGRRDDMLAQVKISALLEEIVGPLRGPDLTIRLDVGPESGSSEREPTIRRDPALLYGLSNIIENACDFAEQEVRITARWDEEHISLTIVDDGPGFAEDVISRLGEPYVTTRGHRLHTLVDPEEEGPGSGMGLGFFIAKTLLERTRATISIANRPAPGHGAIVRIDWPRGAIEAVTTPAVTGGSSMRARAQAARKGENDEQA